MLDSHDTRQALAAEDLARRWIALLTAIPAWHIACAFMAFIYGQTISRFVPGAFTAWFGDAPVGRGLIERLIILLGLVTVTSPATLVSLLIFDVLTRRPTTWKRRIITFCEWQLLVVAVMMSSYEIGLAMWINWLDWALFGPPQDDYSFRNLMFHRLIAWFICTTPVAWVVLWVYSNRQTSAHPCHHRRVVKSQGAVCLFVGILFGCLGTYCLMVVRYQTSHSSNALTMFVSLACIMIGISAFVFLVVALLDRSESG